MFNSLCGGGTCNMFFIFVGAFAKRGVKFVCRIFYGRVFKGRRFDWPKIKILFRIPFRIIF